MPATSNPSIVTRQRPRVPVQAPRSPFGRLRMRRVRPQCSLELISQAIEAIAEARTREEVQDHLLDAAFALTRAVRAEVRSINGGARAVVAESSRGLPSTPDLEVPIHYRDEQIGRLILSLGDGDRPDPTVMEHLHYLCSVAAMSDRLIGRERNLQVSHVSAHHAESKPGVFLLPFLRQLLLLARRRREPLTLLTIGPVEGLRPGIGEDVAAESAMVEVVSRTLRNSDLLVKNDDGVLIAVLPNSSAINAPVVAEAILQAIAGDAAAPKVAIGIATFPEDAREADLLLDAGLVALQNARTLGDRSIARAADVNAPMHQTWVPPTVSPSMAC